MTLWICHVVPGLLSTAHLRRLAFKHIAPPGLVRPSYDRHRSGIASRQLQLIASYRQIQLTHRSACCPACRWLRKSTLTGSIGTSVMPSPAAAVLTGIRDTLHCHTLSIRLFPRMLQCSRQELVHELLPMVFSLALVAQILLTRSWLSCRSESEIPGCSLI